MSYAYIKKKFMVNLEYKDKDYLNERNREKFHNILRSMGNEGKRGVRKEWKNQQI